MGTISLSVPQSGQPNSTEDPKVASDFTTLQTLVNGNIDTNNLSPTAAILGSQLAAAAAISGSQLAAAAGITRGQLAGAFGNLIVQTVTVNTNATDGHLYLLNGAAITLTLPAPAANATVGVVNGAAGSTNGAAASSGAILAVGTPGAGQVSVSLSTQYASAVFVSDGANWYMVTGQQDTGWQALSLATNIAASGGYTPSARLIGDRVFLRGVMQNNTGGAVGLGVVSQVATVPSGLRPAQGLLYPLLSAAGINPLSSLDINVGAYSILPSGALGVVQVSTGVPNSYFIPLDGISYSIS